MNDLASEYAKEVTSVQPRPRLRIDPSYPITARDLAQLLAHIIQHDSDADRPDVDLCGCQGDDHGREGCEDTEELAEPRDDTVDESAVLGREKGADDAQEAEEADVQGVVAATISLGNKY